MGSRFFLPTFDLLNQITMEKLILFALSVMTSHLFAQSVPKCDDEDKNAIYLTYVSFGGYTEIYKIDSVTTNPTELEYLGSNNHDLIGLTVSRNLENATPEYTLYGIELNNNHYFQHDGIDWIDTGHTSGNLTNTINVGGGNEYIYARTDGTFEMFRYDGSGDAIQLGTMGFGASNSFWDVATDVDDNFYIYNTDLHQILMYNPEGIPVDTFPTVGGASGIHPGFAIIGDDVYAWTNNVELYKGVRNGDTFEFEVIATYPTAPQFYDIATCPNRGNVLSTWKDPEYPHMALYPNPAAESVSVRLNGSDYIEVFDMDGRLVDRISSSGVLRVEMDISGYASGCYVVRASNRDGFSRSMRLVKQ